MKRFPLVLLIWLGCAFAWTVLGSSLVARTGSAGGALGREVRLLWGPPHEQHRPLASFETRTYVKERVKSKDAQGREVVSEELREQVSVVDVPIAASTLAVKLDLTHRRKGLLWFPTYDVDFAGRYAFRNPSNEPRDVTFRFPLGGDAVVYDGFEVSDAEGQPIAAAVSGDGASWSARLEPGEERAFALKYGSRGTSTWTYRLTDLTGQVERFSLTMDANFPNVDFAPGSISPSNHRVEGGRWRGTWEFQRLVASAPIGVVLPERMNPGSLASRITFFAPVGLLFFFFVVAILSTARGRSIHPMNYFFFGCAFFAFHLLFAYLVDHLAIAPSFAIASLTSIGLVVSYARLFTGWRFALREIGGAQLIYLVLFSFTFFWEGFTGLAITVGAIVTLFVMMQVTGRTDWSAAASPASPAPRTA
jgi:hypothetical protein